LLILLNFCFDKKIYYLLAYMNTRYNEYIRHKNKYMHYGGFDTNNITVKYMNISRFVKEMINNPEHRIQFENIIKNHKKSNYDILNLINEHNELSKRYHDYKTYIIYLLYDNQVIAIGKVSCHNKMAYISTIHIVEYMRGKKICNFLIKQIIIHTQNHNKNISKFMLYVANDNIAAIKCYKSNGFNIVGSDKKSGDYIMELYI